MSDDIDRTDEYLDLIAEDKRRAQALRNGQDPDDPGPTEPPPDVADQPPPAPPTFLDQLLTVSQLAQLPTVAPLVDGLLYRDTLAQLSGPPGSYKSFIAVNLSCALAAGQSNWEGHRIPTRQRVVYVVAEGASGLHARILAWCERNQVDPTDLDGWLYILPVAVQLGAVIHVDQAIDMVKKVAAGMLVIDTRARCTIGLEENSATEQGIAVEGADRIRAAAECAVWVVHHTGRNATHPRGSTAWDGAVWSDLRLKTEDGTVQITVEKHKDAPSGRTYAYRMIPHTVSENLMPGVPADARNTLVVFQNDGWNPAKIPTQNQERVLELAGNSCGLEGLSRSKLVALAVEGGMAESSAYYAVNALIDSGALTNVGTDKRKRYIVSGPSLGGDTDAE